MFSEPESPVALFARSLTTRSWWRRARSAFVQEARDFCLCTGLHGYKYIVQPGKNRAERCFWGTTVGASMSAAIYVMLIAYQFNSSHQSIIAVDSTHFPIAEVEAPAVTVCPGNKVMRSKAIKLLETIQLPKNVTVAEIVDDMGLLVELVLPRMSSDSRLLRLQSILDHNSLSIDYVIQKVSPTCDELLVRCIWKRRTCVKCSDLFRRIRTGFGFCCSFNYIDREHQKHKARKSTVSSYFCVRDSSASDRYKKQLCGCLRPRLGGCVGVSYQQVQRLSACGYTNGLSVVVQTNQEDYVSSLIGSFGSMVFIHSPWVYPNSNADMKVVTGGTVSFISYLAEVVYSTPRLRQALPPEIRKCRFADEAYLPMFENYTLINCMASCRANLTFHTCGCVPYTYPQILNRRICNLLDVPCLANFEKPAITGQRAKENVSFRCDNCYPDCSTVSYKLETSVGILDWDNAPDGDELIQGISTNEENRFGVFHVFPNDLVTTKYKRDLYMTQEDLLSSLGGLSGLFVGFSLVSGVEIVYFFTLRPLFRMWKRPEEEASTSPVSVQAHFAVAQPHVFQQRRRPLHGHSVRQAQRESLQGIGGAMPAVLPRQFSPVSPSIW